MNPDGTNAEIIGYNYRNSYEQSVTSLGDVFQNDNDDPPACRVSWVMEYANFGFSSNDGQRTWQADRRPGQSIPVAEWRQDDPGMTPTGDVYGGGSPTGNVFYENGALGPAWEGTFFAADAGRNEVFCLQAGAPGRGFRSRPEGLPDVEREAAVRRVGLRRWQRHGARAPSRRCSGRRTSRSVPTARSTSATGSTRASAATRISTTRCRERSTGSRRRASCRRSRRSTPSTIDGLITALRSPAVNVRAIGFEGLKARGAAAVNAVAALLERSQSLHARPRDLPAVSARSRGPAARGNARVAHRSGAADHGLSGDAARESRHPAGGRALARDADAGVRREVARVDARPARRRSLDILVDIARGYDGKDRSYLEALGTGATGKEPALYDRLQPRARRDERSARVVRRPSRGLRGGCTCRRRSPT